MSKILVKIDPSTPAGLRRLRKAWGLNLDQVAQGAGIDPTWLSRAERGLIPMSSEQITRIRKAIEGLGEVAP